ncbi:MAG: hypothetical protein KGJ13_12425, partial [Patescibacteria group bacterium]|nr:hypothetical protein [Patescibacteria group bacterium]
HSPRALPNGTAEVSPPVTQGSRLATVLLGSRTGHATSFLYVPASGSLAGTALEKFLRYQAGHGAFLQNRSCRDGVRKIRFKGGGRNYFRLWRTRIGIMNRGNAGCRQHIHPCIGRQMGSRRDA